MGAIVGELMGGKIREVRGEKVGIARGGVVRGGRE